MGSTNLNAPTLKMTSTAIGLVVILHVLAAMALVMVKSPAPIKPPVSQTPPIEIELLTLPAPSAEPEPVAAVQPTPKPIEPTQAPPVKKAQPIEQPKPEPPKPEPVVEPPKKVAPKEPIVKNKEVKNTEPKKQVAEPVIDTPPEPIKTEPFEHEVVKQAAPPDDSALIEEMRQIAAEKEAAEAQARQEQIAREAAQAAAAEREAQVAREQAAAQAKKDAEAARIAAEKAAAEKAAAAASNMPVNFTASNANWSSPPNLSFPNRAARGARSGDTYNVVLVLRVNKQGGIDSVRLAQSSGNAQLDRAAQRQVRSGKFKPFTKNGVPVVGNVTLPISYAVP